MSTARRFRAGDFAPSAGFYAVVDRDGSVTDVIYRIKHKGTSLPPTYRKGQWFVKVGPETKPNPEAG